MIKNARFEEKLRAVESAVHELWESRSKKSENPAPIDLVDLFSDERLNSLVSQIVRALGGSSPVLGNELVCANLDKDDIAELHQRLFAVKTKIEGFYKYFTAVYVRMLDNVMFSFYTWFVFWAHLPEVPDVTQPG